MCAENLCPDPVCEFKLAFAPHDVLKAWPGGSDTGLGCIVGRAGNVLYVSHLVWLATL